MPVEQEPLKDVSHLFNRQPRETILSWNQEGYDEQELTLACSYAATIAAQGEHSRLAEMRIKYFASQVGDDESAVEFTDEENYYFGHGWKAYLERYGEHSLTLDEIVHLEQPSAHEIGNAIREGVLTHPNALRVYGQLELDETRSLWERMIASGERAVEEAKMNDSGNLALYREDLEHVKATAAMQIREAEQKYLPLVQGPETTLVAHCAKEAQDSMSVAEDFRNGVLRDYEGESAERHYVTAAQWYTVAARVARGMTHERPSAPSKTHVFAEEDATAEQGSLNTTEQLAGMNAAAIRAGIERGSITTPDAVLFLMHKEREERSGVHQTDSSDYLSTQQDQQVYCLQAAAKKMTDQEYQRAFYWYDLAATVAAQKRKSKTGEAHE